uniref:Uncharacterized protein n=1 Tax=Picea glauca TaxID=3330 RepID=A0A117NG35_PICGL|nr:hypothetical protein ABT39_MTgene1726 [Picea glauca]KUM48736.1 hypothetical protein ABT39_MTgene4751 [Picea glauca]
MLLYVLGGATIHIYALILILYMALRLFPCALNPSIVHLILGNLLRKLCIYSDQFPS